MDRMTAATLGLRVHLGLVAATAALALTACTGATERQLTIGTLDAGAFRLVVDDRPTIVLSNATEELVRLETDGVRLGLVSELYDNVNYDAYRLYEPGAGFKLPEDPTFANPDRASFIEAGDGELALELRYPDGIVAMLVIRAPSEGSFEFTLTPTAGAERIAFAQLRAMGGASEGFYGLGEQLDEVNQRGHVRAMQLELDQAIESSNNDAHVPVPLVIGTRGWGLFVRSRLPSAFAIATDDARRVEATIGTGLASSSGLAFHLFAADHPLDVTRRYFDVTGTPKLPARWALGPLVWRDETSGQAEVEADLDSIRDLDLATTGYWIDRPYATGVNTFDFDAAKYADAGAMIAKMHALGFRTAVWHTPYLDTRDAATLALRKEAIAGGYYPPQAGIPLNHWGTLLDLTNPEAVAWWQSKLGAYRDLGIEGYKLDYGEDVVLSPTGIRIPWKFADGTDERTQHAEFPLNYHGTYAPLVPDDGGLLLCRTGSYGDQLNGTVIWPGDLDSTFAKRGEKMKDENGKEYGATGGLIASVVAALSLGPSGFAFYGADTGGYRHCPPDNELFSRWFEQTALSTTMQIGTSCNDLAWVPTAKNGFDAALLARYREYTRLHLRLFPYLWTYAERHRIDGRPIMRALGLAHPELQVHPNDIYLLGDELLVAPVVKRGKTARSVVFPAGEWLHWFTGERFGAGEHEVKAPIGRLPLFLRAGGLVPLLRPTIDTLSPTTEPARVDSYATDTGLLFARAVARTSGEFLLFDGGRIAQASQGAESTLSFEAGTELNQGAVFELLDAAKPAKLTTTGGPLVEHASPGALAAAATGWHYDAKERVLSVKVAAAAKPASEGATATIAW
ncbi:MAG: glycoside hydrolase family 31 protein [Myxococcales bacterium]|nr:glycoside hydrolase family 31 protein [Myxococcales bacterium]